MFKYHRFKVNYLQKYEKTDNVAVFKITYIIYNIIQTDNIFGFVLLKKSSFNLHRNLKTYTYGKELSNC